MIGAAVRRIGARCHPVVFPVSAGLVVAFAIFGTVFTSTAQQVLPEVLTFITDTFGWFFIATVAGLLALCVVLVVTPYGKLRLGPDDSRPDYGYGTWFAMLFSAGMGIGLVFWGVAEPLTHYVDAPREVDGTPAAAADAMVLSFQDWGVGPWAVYAILGLSLAYFGYRHDLPLTVRSALYPLIGDRIHGWMGHTVDTVAVLGTMFGVATSLGLGVMQLNAGLDYVFGISVDTTLQVVLIAAITVLATLSVFSGLDKGIRLLSQGNLVLATALLLFVAVAGPTILLVNAYINNIGNYGARFLETMLWTGAYEGADWLPDWTLFYWAWWISWSPFVGTFIARISRGRTIREFVLGVLLVPTLVSFLWFTVMGNTAIDLQQSGVDLAGPTLVDPAYALFEMLQSLPLSAVMSVVAMVLIVVFFVTSSDSGSFVIGMLSTRGAVDAPRGQRVFWALIEGVLAAALLLAGGLTALQAGALATGLPFTAVLVVVAVGLVKALRAERAGTAFSDIPDLPLLGSNGDAEHAADEHGGDVGGGDDELAELGVADGDQPDGDVGRRST